MSNNLVSEDTARHLIGALERVLEVFPAALQTGGGRGIGTDHANVRPLVSGRPSTTNTGTGGQGLGAAPARRWSTTTDDAAAPPASTSGTVVSGRRAPTVPSNPTSNPLRRSRALHEHGRLFGYTPSAQPQKKKKFKLFTRIVVCLADCQCEVVPSKDEKNILKANGLGEASVDFEVDGDAEHVLGKILSTFKKTELESGFEFMALRARSRSVLEVVHSGPCSAMDLKLFSSQRIYIRPIQQDISLSEFCPPSSKATLSCKFCDEIFPTNEIRAHVEQCKESDPLSSQDVQPIEPDQHQSQQEQVRVHQDHHHGTTVVPDMHEEQTPPSEDCSDNQEMTGILEFLKEGFNDSDPSEIVSAFRQLYLEGRSLNMTGGDDMFLEGETYDIMISRHDIFNGMVDELSADVYKPRLPLKVEFMGERGSDLGGPRKEFLRLALSDVYQRLTTSTATSRSLVSEQAPAYLNKKVFYVAGIVIGQCIMQDGPRPDFLAADLVNRLIEGPQDPCEVQVADGLQRTGVISMIKAFPQCASLLGNSEERRKLTATMVIGSFEPKFSEPGTNNRVHEEMMMGHFIRFLLEVEAGQHRCENNEIMDLKTILKFVTGLEDMPVCGWNPPLTVAFIPQDVTLMGIGACTCSHQLQLPIPGVGPNLQMPARSIIFELFSKSFPDQFFGKA